MDPAAGRWPADRRRRRLRSRSATTGPRTRSRRPRRSTATPTTAWRTEHYNTADLGGEARRRPRARRSRRRRSLVGRASTPTARAGAHEVYVADDTGDDARRAGDSPAASGDDLRHVPTFDLSPARQRPRVLLWFTHLPDRDSSRWPRCALADRRRPGARRRARGAASAGDRRALEVLLERHADRVHAMCRRDRRQPRGRARRDAGGADRDRARHRPLRRALGVHHVDVPRRDERRARRAPPATAPTRPVEDLPGADGRRDGIEDPVDARLDVDAALASLPEEFRVAVVLRDLLRPRLRRDRRRSSTSRPAPCGRGSPAGASALARRSREPDGRSPNVQARDHDRRRHHAARRRCRIDRDDAQPSAARRRPARRRHAAPAGPDPLDEVDRSSVPACRVPRARCPSRPPSSSGCSSASMLRRPAEHPATTAAAPRDRLPTTPPWAKRSTPSATGAARPSVPSRTLRHAARRRGRRRPRRRPPPGTVEALLLRGGDAADIGRRPRRYACTATVARRSSVWSPSPPRQPERSRASRSPSSSASLRPTERARGRGAPGDVRRS